MRPLLCILPLVLGLVLAHRSPARADQVEDLLTTIAAEEGKAPTKIRALVRALSPDDARRLFDAHASAPRDRRATVERAMQSLAFEAGAGASPTRASFDAAARHALGGDAPVPTKVFVLDLLCYGDATPLADVLAETIRSPDLAPNSIRALATIDPETACAALTPALARAMGDQLVQVIDAIGTIGYAPCASNVRPFAADDTHPEVARVARWTLARLGDPAIRAHIEHARRDGRAPEGDQWLLTAAERWTGANQPEGPAAYRELLLRGRSSPHIRCAALRGLAEAEGAGAMAEIIAGLTSDPELQAVARSIAMSVPGDETTPAFIAALTDAKPPTRRAIMEVLGERGDPSAIPVVRRALEDPSGEVRMAAVRATTRLGGDGAVGALIAVLDSAHHGVVTAARDTLIHDDGAGTSGVIGASLESVSDGVRVTLIDILGRRQATDQLPRIEQFIASPDPKTRRVVIAAMGRLGDESAVPRILARIELEGQTSTSVIIDALAAVCRRIPDAEKRAAPLLQSLDLESPENSVIIISALCRVGGPDALDTVRRALEDPRPPVSRAAYFSLAAWEDPGGAPTILEIAAKAAELKNHVVCLRAYSRLVEGNARLAAAEKSDRLRLGLAACRRPQEQRQFLASLGRIPDVAALRILVPYLEQDAVENEAAAAVVAVAEAILPSHLPIVRPALDRVIQVSDIPSLGHRAKTALVRCRNLDAVVDWRVCGPYRKTGKNGLQLLDVPFPPELEEGSVQWKPQPVSAGSRYWFLDLNAALGASNAVAYLATDLHSDRKQDVILELGSDDGIKVWLNGQVIHHNPVARGCDQAQDHVRVTLEAGKNPLLFKVADLGGGWAACLRLRTPEGDKVSGVRASAE